LKQFLLCVACFVPSAAPLAAQAVGSLPENSPYQDVRGGQRFGVEGGYLVTSRDPAGVGPKSGPYIGLKYDFHAGGPAYLSGRLFGLSTERDVLDYTRKAAVRRVGTESVKMLGGDAGLELALTGDRSWHKWQPLLEASGGFVSGIGAKTDVSGYKVGPRFYLTYGFGARYVFSQNTELRGDIVWFAWQLKYPDTYKSTDADPVAIVPTTGSLSPWTRNRLMSVSWSWGVFR
jgi:hypothetical protein